MPLSLQKTLQQKLQILMLKKKIYKGNQKLPPEEDINKLKRKVKKGENELVLSSKIKKRSNQE